MSGMNLDHDISGNDPKIKVPKFHCYSDFHLQSFPLSVDVTRLNDIILKGLCMYLVLERDM